jgi:hypothetical protein
MSMYLSRTVPVEGNPDGFTSILEVTPEVLGYLVASCAKEGSQASEDAVLMLLTNGAEQVGQDGVRWQRVQKPLNFVPCPTKCDITDEPLGSVMYDGKTARGPWACMSERGWSREGCGRVGPGFAQKYRRNEEGHFYLSEGMSSRPKPYRVAA